jgi:hypothetical protein
MSKVKVEYINFNPKLHKEFPIIRSCKVYQKNDIINVFIDTNKDIESIADDFGYDSIGKYYFIEYGQWHNIYTGKYIALEDFYALDEFEYETYEYVSFNVRLYSNKDYHVSYHDKSGSKMTISYIPKRILEFTEQNADIIFKL